MAVKIVQLVPVSVYAKLEHIDKSTAYDRVNSGVVTVYELPVKKLNEKPKRFVEKPLEKRE